MPDPKLENELPRLNDILDGIEEAIDAYNEGHEAADQVEELSDELAGLRERIKSARDDPESLSGDVYTQLIIDMIMVIPKKLPIPKSLLLFIEAAARVVGVVLGVAVDFSVSISRNRFLQNLREGTNAQETAEFAQEAAKIAAPTLQGQLSLLWWWSQDMPVGPSLGTRIWNQIEAFFGSVFGTFGVAFPSRIGCMSILFVAFLFLAVSIFAGWILLSIGNGDDGALVGNDVPTATSTPTALPTPDTDEPTPTPTPTPEPASEAGEAILVTDPAGDADCPEADILSATVKEVEGGVELTVVTDQPPTESLNKAFSYAQQANFGGQSSLVQTHDGRLDFGLTDANGNIVASSGSHVNWTVDGVTTNFPGRFNKGDTFGVIVSYLANEGDVLCFDELMGVYSCFGKCDD